MASWFRANRGLAIGVLVGGAHARLGLAALDRGEREPVLEGAARSSPPALALAGGAIALALPPRRAVRRARAAARARAT